MRHNTDPVSGTTRAKIAIGRSPNTLQWHRACASFYFYFQIYLRSVQWESTTNKASPWLSLSRYFNRLNSLRHCWKSYAALSDWELFLTLTPVFSLEFLNIKTSLTWSIRVQTIKICCRSFWTFHHWQPEWEEMPLSCAWQSKRSQKIPGKKSLVKTPIRWVTSLKSKF